MPKTINLKGDPIRKEEIASVAICPGELIEFVPSGADIGQLRLHGDAGGDAVPMFALENSIVGDDIDDEYADGATVLYGFFRQGDEVYAFLANGQSVKKGAFLESDGLGALRAHVAKAINLAGTVITSVYVKAIVAKAAEDKANATGSPVRIKVEVV